MGNWNNSYVSHYQWGYVEHAFIYVDISYTYNYDSWCVIIMICSLSMVIQFRSKDPSCSFFSKKSSGFGHGFTHHRGAAISDSLICPAMMFSAAFFNLFLDLARSDEGQPLRIEPYSYGKWHSCGYFLDNWNKLYLFNMTFYKCSIARGYLNLQLSKISAMSALRTKMKL